MAFPGLGLNLITAGLCVVYHSAFLLNSGKFLLWNTLCCLWLFGLLKANAGRWTWTPALLLRTSKRLQIPLLLPMHIKSLRHLLLFAFPFRLRAVEVFIHTFYSTHFILHDSCHFLSAGFLRSLN